MAPLLTAFLWGTPRLGLCADRVFAPVSKTYQGVPKVDTSDIIRGDRSDAECKDGGLLVRRGVRLECVADGDVAADLRVGNGTLSACMQQ